MNRFTYENLGANTYLVYEIGAEDVVDSMTLGMLTHNKINGLAGATFTQMDTQKFIKYNVTSHVPVKQIFSGSVRRKQLLGVFTGIVEAMLSAEDYMIDEGSMVLDLEYMYTDVSTYKTVLICLPVEQKGERVQLENFFKEILFTTRFDQTENCDHVAQLINHLNGTVCFSPAAFKEVLDKLQGIAPVVSAPAPVPAHAKATPVPVKPAPTVASASVTLASAGTPVPQTSATPVKPVASVQKPVSDGMVVHDGAVPAGKNAAEAPADGAQKMSMFYLLQHYNKENAALYKAQKEAAKGESAKAEKPAKEKKEKKDKKAQSAAPAGVGFSVPGIPAGVGFSVPGTPAGVVYSVPGQTPAAPAASVAPQPVASVQRPVTPQPIVPAQKPVAPVATPKPVSVPAPASTPAPPVVKPVAAPSAMTFGDTTILGSNVIGETTVLNLAVSVQRKPFLVRLKNNEKIPLNKPVFRIGKERSYVDYFISDNPVVSRSHANVISRNGAYYVVDTNSTNHTYLNGDIISPNEEYPLVDGSKLRFGNEDFEFKIF